MINDIEWSIHDTESHLYPTGVTSTLFRLMVASVIVLLSLYFIAVGVVAMKTINFQLPTVLGIQRINDDQNPLDILASKTDQVCAGNLWRDSAVRSVWQRKTYVQALAYRDRWIMWGSVPPSRPAAITISCILGSVRSIWRKFQSWHRMISSACSIHPISGGNWMSLATTLSVV